MRSGDFSRVGLLGTKFTMTQDFYRKRLSDTFGIDVIIPGEEEQDFVHSVIYEELCRGVVNPESRLRYLEIIRGLSEQGAEGVILGCTEVPLLVGQEDTDTPLFDTTRIHAEAGVEMALGV